ncbi:MAG: ribosome maturation factor RimP [Ilumatobacteraceae bacterium]|mgnify:FL=1|jgi:ribosome maturation factor RimP
MTESALIATVTTLVAPIVADLKLDLYDLEMRSGTLRITLDSPPGSEGGISLDRLALASRLISKELDAADPMPGRYTLEVTSPGLERSLRTPAHFQRELGKTIAVRLRDVVNDERRLTGELVEAGATTMSMRLTEPPAAAGQLRSVAYEQIDRARTVFVWGPAPKPGKGPKAPKPAKPAAAPAVAENAELVKGS